MVFDVFGKYIEEIRDALRDFTRAYRFGIGYHLYFDCKVWADIYDIKPPDIAARGKPKLTMPLQVKQFC